jgi:transposase InsO family protein
MKAVYEIAGVSKQAVSQHFTGQHNFDQKLEGLIVEADTLKAEHPGCGVEKMYYTLQPDWLGRDKFIDLFMDLGYRVKKIRNYTKTTIPVHSKYKNLIEGMLIHRKNQVWQSDITYFPVGSRFYYIVFIIDVYTKEIMGYQVSDHMRAEANILALKMAFKNSDGPLDKLIHHSDRGSQYIDGGYTKMLNDKEIAISMGEKAQDNAYAERINGTIKNEYLKYRDIQSLNDLRKEVKKAVNHYNEKRKHRGLPKWMSPKEFKKELLDLGSQKRPKVIIYAEGNYKIREALSHPDFKPKEEPQAHNCPIVI